MTVEPVGKEDLGPRGRIAIIGAGSIGVGFSVVFAMAGYEVRLWDVAPAAMGRAQQEIDERLVRLHSWELLNEPVTTVAARISMFTDLSEAVAGAILVQECVPEDLQLKRHLFEQLADLSDDNTVFASSSSAFVPSSLAEGIPGRDRIIVGHPGNPPYLIPVIEIVPSVFTSSWTMDRAESIYRHAQLQPVRLMREVEGFIFNRIQGAVLREAYCLVRDGVGTVEDIDQIVRTGLGLRWSVVGPFETADLNTRGGISSHAQKMGPAYERMGAERGQRDRWTVDLVAEVARQRREILPLADWEDRVRWRDDRLMARKRDAHRE